MNFFKCRKLGFFAGGVLFGTAGVKILSSRDARKVYTEVVAAGLRVRDCVLATTSKVQENAEDILEEAKAVNESRKAEAAADAGEEEQV